MYGIQDAANIWQKHYTRVLEEAGFTRGRSNGAVFYHKEKGIRVLVHGGDFLVLGTQGQID